MLDIYIKTIHRAFQVVSLGERFECRNCHIVVAMVFAKRTHGPTFDLHASERFATCFVSV